MQLKQSGLYFSHINAIFLPQNRLFVLRFSLFDFTSSLSSIFLCERNTFSQKPPFSPLITSHSPSAPFSHFCSSSSQLPYYVVLSTFDYFLSAFGRGFHSSQHFAFVCCSWFIYPKYNLQRFPPEKPPYRHAPRPSSGVTNDVVDHGQRLR